MPRCHAFLGCGTNSPHGPQCRLSMHDGLIRRRRRRFGRGGSRFVDGGGGGSTRFTPRRRHSGLYKYLSASRSQEP